MKKIFSLAAVLVLLVVPASPEAQVPAPACPKGTCTMTGSAIRLVPSPSTAPPFQCNSMLIQAQPGNTNLVYILNAPPNVTMAYNGAGTTTVATLGVGTTTTPGNSFTFPSNGSGTTQSGGFDLRNWGIYGTSPDTVTATCDARQ
jgi:hypothetical protein